MSVLLRPVNSFLGQVIGNASEGKYNTVNNSSSVEVTFQKCLNSGITLFSSKNSNKSQAFATGAYQRLHEARPRRVVWLWEPEYNAADGTFDRELIARCMPHLETYEAVDIDPDALNHLKDVYSTTDYRVLTHSSNAEDWTGPENNAAVISLIHVLYYVTDVAALLNKCMTWLSPGGRIIICLAGEDAFQKEIQREKNPQAKVRDWIKSRQEKNAEYRIEGTHNMVGLEHSTAGFLMRKQLNEEEVKDVTDSLLKKYDDLSRLPSSNLVWVICKTYLF